MNLSLISLTLHQISTSPFISFTPTLNYPDYTFQSIKISYSFQSYFSLWTQFPCYFNFIYVKNSHFSKFLTSAIFINYDVSKLAADMKLTIQNEFLTQNSDFYQEIRVQNCCFSECQTNSFQHGGALYLKGVESWTIANTVGNLSNCTFYKCYSAHDGSAIYIDGQSLYMQNMEFSNCEADEFGVIYYEYGSHYQKSAFEYVDIHDCKGNIAILSLTDDSNYNSINITNCENKVYHDSTSPDQYPSAFLLKFNAGSSAFQFFNLFENSGDVVFQYEHKVSYGIAVNSVNIISNKNLNRIIEVEVVSPHELSNFYFFNNAAASAAGLIPIYDANSNDIVTFANSFFDLPETTVKSNCIKCQFSTCSFGVSSIQTQVFDYMQSYQFLNPFGCILEIQPTDIVSVSSVSDHVTSPFTAIIDHTTSPFTPTIDHATSPFTPSDSFTPSNFFTPNRTKYPDGLNKLEQADIRGEHNLFSAEELKKAAAPATLSLALIIVSVVMTVIYIRRKMKEVLNRDNIPDFDVEDSYDDPTYSYSFYTYESYSEESSGDHPLELQQSKTVVGTGEDLLDTENESASYSEFTDENLEIDINFDPHF